MSFGGHRERHSDGRKEDVWNREDERWRMRYRQYDSRHRYDDCRNSSRYASDWPGNHHDLCHERSAHDRYGDQRYPPRSSFEAERSPNRSRRSYKSHERRQGSECRANSHYQGRSFSPRRTKESRFHSNYRESSSYSKVHEEAEENSWRNETQSSENSSICSPEALQVKKIVSCPVSEVSDTKQRLVAHESPNDRKRNLSETQEDIIPKKLGSTSKECSKLADEYTATPSCLPSNVKNRDSTMSYAFDLESQTIPKRPKRKQSSEQNASGSSHCPEVSTEKRLKRVRGLPENTISTQSASGQASDIAVSPRGASPTGVKQPDVKRRVVGRRSQRVIWDDESSDGELFLPVKNTSDQEVREKTLTEISDNILSRSETVCLNPHFSEESIHNSQQRSSKAPGCQRQVETIESGGSLKEDIGDLTASVDGTSTTSAKGTRKFKSKKRVTSSGTWQITKKKDTSQHQKSCHICDKEIVPSDSGVCTETATALFLHCSSCLKSYHTACVLQGDETDQQDWICPACLGLDQIRKVSFFRNSTSSYFVSDPPPSLDVYLREVCGLTGHQKGCGRCGGLSSQRRIAVICDNCDREWHIGCLGIETDEVPWGNWLCPDCSDLHVCMSCVLNGRSINNAPCNSNADDTDMISGKTIVSQFEGAHFYHEGDLLRCLFCKLRYHFECVKGGAPKHLKYTWETLRTKYQQSFSLRGQSLCSDLSKTTESQSIDNSDHQIDNVELKRFSFRHYLSQMGLSRIQTQEPWCCEQCQEHLGLQRIVSQRRWIDPFSLEEQIQLLVKFKNISYRTLQWLPADRVKTLSPNIFRKWQQSKAALVLLGKSQLKDEPVIHHDSGDDDQLTEMSDEEDALTMSSRGVVDELDVDTTNNTNQTNSASIQKLKLDKSNSFVLHVKRPSGIRAEWFCPNRVIASRVCPRGTTEKQFLVKWASLGYNETSWENYCVVRGTRALKLFQCFEYLEKLLTHRPANIIRGPPEDDITITDLIVPSLAPPVMPTGATIVQGCRFLIQTEKVNADKSKMNYLPGAEASDECNDITEPDKFSAFFARKGREASTLERRKRDFSRGAFAPYCDRPEFLGGQYLFDYQLEGVNWLRFAWTKERSVILADEMGLGKTIQVISFLGSLWNDFVVQGPFLIIAPVATLEDVWMRELMQWAPFINTVSYFGNPEARQVCRDSELFYDVAVNSESVRWFEKCFESDLQREYDRSSIRPRLPKLANSKRYAKFDALITSYEIFRKDHSLFEQIDWKVVVVDEGHRLKSFTSEVKKALESCRASMRLLLTGTPLQNSIDELFSLLNVLHPEKFPEGCYEDFQDVTQEATIEKLKSELQPHILRRIKKDVMGGRMPTKKERILRIENSPAQKEIYKNIILRNHFVLGSASPASAKLPNQNKKAQRTTSLRNIVMQMRKCCNHPYLFEEVLPIIQTEEDFKHLVESSGKLQLLDRMLQLLLEDGHRVLIFSQFMRMLDILEEYLIFRRYGFERLDGSTSAIERQKAIDRFNVQSHKKFVFLLSTRAGGLGINLTSADTVIIFDSDWNPHNDLQAQARAHRLGQTKKVAIFRYMTRATVEERIIEIARGKLVLDQVVAGRLDPRDAEAVVRCGAKEMFDGGDASKEVYYDDLQLKAILSREDVDDETEIEEKITEATKAGDGVLDAFKVAHFETEENVPEDDLDTDPNKFWDELLKHHSTNMFHDDQGDEIEEEEELGRGMRARKEVSYFGQEKYPAVLSSPTSSENSNEAASPGHVKNKVKSNENRNKEGIEASINDSEISTPKTKKRRGNPFDDQTALLFFSTSKVHETQDIRFEAKGFVNEKESTYLSVFRTICGQNTLKLLQLGRALRRSIGISEGSKLLKFTEPSNDDLNNRKHAVLKLINSAHTCRNALDVDWSLEWLGKLATHQFSRKFPAGQPFIIYCSGQHYAISYPISLSPYVEDQYVATLRLLKVDEVNAWRAKLSLMLLTKETPTQVPIKTGSTAKSTKSIEKPQSSRPIDYPDFTSLREFLKSAEEEEECVDHLFGTVNETALIEDIWRTCV